ncbi:hypothetical protein HYQ45_004291 [Verticillium longisporum]|uniref:Uncharacterized protein n=1 Tax=Verticillium longisporum TaxID=100787 RepID=A0A0G4KIY6_VERLO|nr:hypothetical protein HYQ44_015483 [Verticillium longisporum]KAG7138540.1 hypothetical protein HYQ45_004291 [Verticillium longisporum]CRK01973.1 hypothetical protein BN1708_009591 [Verticillium longisporum]CRK44329.1 hypothetical protein BN1723_006038 [Verticillium longisporum]
MSFFAGDSRPSEAPPPPHGGLKTTEIGVIVGAVTAVVLFIAIIFVRRMHSIKKEQRRAQEANDVESAHHAGEAAEHKGDADDPFRNDASSGENLPQRPKPIRMKLASYLPRTITTRLFKAHLEADTEMTSRHH